MILFTQYLFYSNTNKLKIKILAITLILYQNNNIQIIQVKNNSILLQLWKNIYIKD